MILHYNKKHFLEERNDAPQCFNWTMCHVIVSCTRDQFIIFCSRSIALFHIQNSLKLYNFNYFKSRSS